jgi:mRNA interferase RelE/StbE
LLAFTYSVLILLDLPSQHSAIAKKISNGFYKVEFTTTGIDSLERLAPTIRERILRKIRWLSENFENVAHLALSADLRGLFKLRVGDYRIIYSFDVKTQLLTIHKTGHRRDIYN